MEATYSGYFLPDHLRKWVPWASERSCKMTGAGDHTDKRYILPYGKATEELEALGNPQAQWCLRRALTKHFNGPYMSLNGLPILSVCP